MLVLAPNVRVSLPNANEVLQYEKQILKPVSLYGSTKVEAEKLIMEHGNSICFRLATVFGFSHRMRTDLLVNNFVMKAVNFKKNVYHIS